MKKVYQTNNNVKLMLKNYLRLMLFSTFALLTTRGLAQELDRVYVEGVGEHDERTGYYEKANELENNKPVYTKGSLKLYYDSSDKWRLVKIITKSIDVMGVELLGLSNEAGKDHPWRASYSENMSVDIYRSYRWGDNFTISLNYNDGLYTSAKRYMLQGTSTKGVFFKHYDMRESLDQQSKQTAWRIVSVGEDSDYYVIRSIYNLKYLVMNDNGDVLGKNISCGEEDCFSDGKNVRAQWRIEAASDQNDLVLINGKLLDGEERLLHAFENNNPSRLNVSTIPANEVDKLRNDILVNINNRFIRMYLHPKDIQAQNGRLALNNDLKVTRLFIPSPDINTEEKITRRYSIHLLQKGNGVKYTFEKNIGKPDEESGSEYQQRLKALVDEAMNFDVVKNNMLTEAEVNLILDCQLRNSYNNEKSFTKGILWIPKEGVDPDCELQNIAVFDNNNRLTKRWHTRIYGSEMKIIKEVTCKSTEKNMNSFACNNSDYFGFLIKERRGDITRFRIFDPTDLTGVDPQ